MEEQDDNKYRYEATKSLLHDLLVAGSGLTILNSRPSGSMFNLAPFLTANEFDRKKLRRTLRHAKNYKYIDVKEKNNEITITLLEAGHLKALKYSIEAIHIPKQITWDKKWRLVIFDIPETKRLARNVFKDKLDEMGFVQIQKSIYVHPYPCHNEIEFIRSLYDLGPYIRLGILDKIEGEDALRKRFGL